MPLKRVITIILLAVVLGTGAEYFFIIRNGGDPFADIARLTGGSVAYALIVALVLLVGVSISSHSSYKPEQNDERAI
jgi:hypothetical protein